jgi:tetratricopeptide (TPR) repeat protein
VKRALWLIVAAALPVAGQTPGACQEHRRYGRLRQAAQCFAALTESANPYLRAEGYWGLERYREANDQFRLAVEREPKNADYRVRWGRLYLERYQPADAAELFREALAIEEKHAGALLGLALVASEGFEAKAVELAEAALKSDPKLVEAQELLAYLALEDVNETRAIEQADKALAISPEALDAMAIRATIDWLNDRAATPWIDRILQINPVYGEAYATAAHFFVLNRRYEEGIELYRKALELNPRLWKARSELGINLMRLGREEEARRHLEQCYENGYQSYATVNTLRLLDSYKNFETFRDGGIILRLHKKEAALLRPYFAAELKRAIATYEKKYGLKLDRPVQLEVYPDHEDFAVRTLGMPGLGALGVTFGTVVAMDSPSGRRPGTFHWASTLWHELSHVFVLAATRHRVPRWFTEGMAVHEETAISPEWGDRLDAASIQAIREGKLLPVASLDRGFIRPTYPAQVVVSYFQAGRICDYIAERWGYGKLLEMMRAFGERRGTREVIEQALGMKPEEFDRAFLGWLQGKTQKIVEGFDAWKKGMKALAEAAAAGRHGEVLEKGPALRDLYPEYVEEASAYELIAAAHLAKGDKSAAADELERYARAGGRSPALLKQLAQLRQEQKRDREAAAALERLLYIYPVNDEELHRRLGDLWFGLGNLEAAIREYQAVLAMNPLDQAASQFNLAKAYRAAGRHEEALRHVVLSLEAAPGYRPAQKMLLELSAAQTQERKD